MKKSVHTLFVATALSSSLWTASALPVTPSSYTFTPTDKHYQYADSTGRELIDGQFGTAQLIPEPNKEPWVGWGWTPLVTINFEFDQLTTLESVTVDALQTFVGSIVLPNVSLLTSVDGTTWTPVANLLTPVSSANDYRKTALTLDNLDLTTEYLQIQLHRNPTVAVNTWIFVDEVTFSAADSGLRALDATSVPDATGSFALLGIGIAALGAFRRMRS